MPGTFDFEQTGHKDHLFHKQKKMANTNSVTVKEYLSEDDFGYSAKVKYKLKATIEPNQANRGVVKPIKYTQPIVIREINKCPRGNQTKECNIPVNSCFCISKGRSMLRCYFEKDTYVPGEIANVFFFCLLFFRPFAKSTILIADLVFQM